jgi:hypothetical protein
MMSNQNRLETKLKRELGDQVLALNVYLKDRDRAVSAKVAVFSTAFGTCT